MLFLFHLFNYHLKLIYCYLISFAIIGLVFNYRLILAKKAIGFFQPTHSLVLILILVILIVPTEIRLNFGF